MTSNIAHEPATGHDRCQGVTTKGEPCKNKALDGDRFCAFHSGQKTVTTTAASPMTAIAEMTGEDPESALERFKEFAAWWADMMLRRRRGDYEVDPWGFDEEWAEQARGLFTWLYRKYWRVKTTGIENVPAEGRGLLVANHSGVLPWDGAMVIMAVQEEQPEQRMVRALVLSLFFQLPFSTPLLSKVGQVQALPANSERLLNNDELTLVFPEGVKGIGKPFRKRYQLARFGRGGFVRIALKTRSPIIPVSIVGAEEIYPMIFNLKPLASLFGLPYVPITPTFPWLGPLGAIPLPTRWHIHFGKPVNIPDMKYRPSEEPLLVSKISALVRDTIQKNIYEILKKRRSVFL